MGQTDLLASQLRDAKVQPAVIRFYCVMVLLLAGLLLGMNFVTSNRGRTLLGPPLGGDYGTFYVAGRILNTIGPSSLYNAKVHDRLLHQVLPNLPADQSLPFAHAPFFALLFRPLTILPYEWSYLVWLLICITLYLAGFALLWGSLDSLRARPWGIPVLLLLAFEPLVIESLIGGQATAFGFFFLALAIRWMDKRGSLSYRSGLAISLLLYKPPLLIFLLPMLLVSRQFRALLGFLLGGGFLVAITSFYFGHSIWASYYHMLQAYRLQSSEVEPIFRTIKYVDIHSFSRLLMPSHATLNSVLGAVAIGMAIVILAFYWLRVSRYSTNQRLLLLAATIAWTNPFNLYSPMYDATLVSLAVILMATAVYGSESNLTVSFRTLLILLCVVPWISQPLARTIHFQPMTLVLILAGVYALKRVERNMTELGVIF